MFRHLMLDRFWPSAVARAPEPALVMEDARQVESFMRAGREDGILAFTYFYNALQTLQHLRPGDTVLDLGCGPANQLACIARMHPQTHFVGVDASAAMLEEARATAARSGLTNLSFRLGDIRRLEGFASASVDAVISTLSLHHLPDLAGLEACFREIRRVLRPGGGLFLTDFGRLRRVPTQEFFARDRAAEQPALFTQDYRNSLAAAFSYAEFARMRGLLGEGVALRRTWIAPFMVTLHGAPRATPGESDLTRMREIFGRLGPDQQRDFRDFARLFAMGGLALPYQP